jgi:hypothetical protein
MTRVLSHDVYTVNAIDEGTAAFAPHCDATVVHRESESVITINSVKSDMAWEMLNYILALSARELLP